MLNNIKGTIFVSVFHGIRFKVRKYLSGDKYFFCPYLNSCHFQLLWLHTTKTPPPHIYSIQSTPSYKIRSVNINTRDLINPAICVMSYSNLSSIYTSIITLQNIIIHAIKTESATIAISDISLRSRLFLCTLYLGFFLVLVKVDSLERGSN